MKYILIVMHLFWCCDVKTVASTITLPGEIIIGKKEAPILIHAYTSLSCGHCSEFHHIIYPKLKAKYIDTGQVRFVFRHFPIDLPSIQATRIVMEVSPIKQMQVIGILFKRQNEWMSAKDPAPLFAEISELSVDRCRKLIGDKASMQPALDTRILAEKQLHIDGTPYFVINGRIIDHSPSWDELEKHLKKNKA